VSAIDGEEHRLRSLGGRQGIIAITETVTALRGHPEKESTTKYVGRDSIYWRWRADTKTISENGFVPLSGVNKVLGYRPNYTLRGHGGVIRYSGLKEISVRQYEDLVSLYKKHPRHLSGVKHAIKASQKAARQRDGVEESEEHRQLKDFIAENPSKRLGERGLTTLHKEFPFPTHDKADLVLVDREGRIVGLEVEVSVSDDEITGVLQAIKYRFMLALMKERKYFETRAFLVAYSISQAMRQVCKFYDVETFTINRNDVAKWANAGE
jgi:hypothetical protein